ncbi:multiheme c-type cytochrome [Rhodopirellula halodulae]|uniref:multiheme c-type cytochrome n=1 Tax=Rhodopirellula halodulae TaxID=2894198 RepID=UPI001E2DE0FB|nr:multiheme c-type cytochrome [Rhodopirellula sp. JC737]MCC9654798.1 C cytochrome precursor [Rhodopirellula sp. JC737]
MKSSLATDAFLPFARWGIPVFVLLGMALRTDAQDTAAQFVGKAVCAECHQVNHRLHAMSGHASTFSMATEPSVARLFDGKTVDAGTEHGLLTYQVSDDGLRVDRYATAIESTTKQPNNAIDGDPKEQAVFPYALGSGRNAITLLSLMNDQDGSFAIEHRVSWYPKREPNATHNKQDGYFGLTPGHDGDEPSDWLDCFGQKIRGQKLDSCIECHSTTGQVDHGQLVDLIPNVNCERCHGPGSEHVQQARRSDSPPPFSVGQTDWDFEAELQLCGSCHRLPRHLSPKELRDYSSELLRLQPVGLLRSECYLQSDGKLMCSTCHNPHMDAKQKTKDQYDADCRACHQPAKEDHVVCSISTDSGCVDCHMPAIAVEQGMTFHDHWIRIRDE